MYALFMKTHEKITSPMGTSPGKKKTTPHATEACHHHWCPTLGIPDFLGVPMGFPDVIDAVLYHET